MTATTAVIALIAGVTGIAIFAFSIAAVALSGNEDPWMFFSVCGLGIHTLALGVIVEVKAIK